MKKHREKDSYTYKVEIVDGVEMFKVAFTGGENRTHEVSVSREVFTSLRQLQLAENRQAYKAELYISHYIEDVDNDDDVSYIAFAPMPSVEEEAEASELIDIIAVLIRKLTDRQRRRFLMYRVDGLSYREIAKREKCSLLTVYQSVNEADKKFREIIKNFSEDT